jgi:hypothetical protein
MKYLWLFFISNLALASGTLTLKKPLFGENKRTEVGLYVIEPMTNKLEYQAWTGASLNYWFNTQHYMLYKVNNKLSLGLGPSYQYSNDYNHDVRGEAVLQWKLWN